MQLEWPHGKCVVCLDGKADSQEHLLPQCIGGRLKANLLCGCCNKTLGSILVSRLKGDPGIILAVEALSTTVPVFVATFREGCTYSAQKEDGTVLKAVYRNGRLKLRAGIGANGSLVQDTADTRKSINKHLQKLGCSPEEVAKSLQRFDALAEDSPLELPGRRVVKRVAPHFRTDLSGGWLDPRFAILLAYEYLALVLGENIYHPGLNGVRNFIRGGDEDRRVKVERFAGEAIEAAHAICIIPGNDSFVIDIRLFRAIVFRVSFQGIVFRAQDIVYYEDLQLGRSMVATSLREAQMGLWKVT